MSKWKSMKQFKPGDHAINHSVAGMGLYCKVVAAIGNALTVIDESGFVRMVTSEDLTRIDDLSMRDPAAYQTLANYK